MRYYLDKILKNKSPILILLILLSISCSNQDDNVPVEEPEIPGSIIGKWVIYEKCSFEATSSSTCETVREENQYYYEFEEDNSFATNRFIEGCNNGIYNLENDSLYIELGCNYFTVPVLKLTTKELYLETLGDDGGTTHKYRRVENK